MTNHSGMKTIVYEIRVAEFLDAKWGDWFDGMIIIQNAASQTLISGPVPDQAALYGLLKKVRDAGLSLLSVNPVEQK